MNHKTWDIKILSSHLKVFHALYVLLSLFFFNFSQIFNNVYGEIYTCSNKPLTKRFFHSTCDSKCWSILVNHLDEFTCTRQGKAYTAQTIIMNSLIFQITTKNIGNEKKWHMPLLLNSALHNTGFRIQNYEKQYH